MLSSFLKPKSTKSIYIRVLQKPYSTRNIFEEKDDEVSTLTKKQQLPNDKPWDGEEPVYHSVLRMIMDKYRTPLRVQGAARRNLPNPQSNYAPPIPIKERSAQQKQMERQEKQRQRKQQRITNAKDAAFDYAMDRKYDAKEKEATKEPLIPRNINEWVFLTDQKIRAAQTQGVFDHLPGRGKPIPQDPWIHNPFVDRTEYFLNRIIQRNGAAPPWIVMQQEVNAEIHRLRSQWLSAMKRCQDEIREQHTLLTKARLVKKFEKIEKSFFEKEVERINARLKSYNVICPMSVRKQLLEFDKELAWTLEMQELE
ncbi:uncharacterized protein B0P05DRAFT_587016 [Gilbertella persicaria]|uniref:uncharacterized protein n=1 Tax=Gilbertella persicaria TaxID=101096 RepID=UPI00221E85A6|nr:uncharacterized protein B0P05DRAFT_587016 [Gilbertella persicaria]KAI8079555.1 hypothetical protein B0P05DRAFT_587016 [Gilbertella persicaria]